MIGEDGHSNAAETTCGTELDDMRASADDQVDTTDMAIGSLPDWVRDYLNRYRKPLVSALLLGFLGFVCAVALMWASGYLISRTAEQGVFLMMVMVPIACVQLFGIGKPLAHYFERLFSHDWVFRVTSDLRKELYLAIEQRTSAAGGSYALGDVLGMLAEDIGHLQNLYLRVVFPTIVAYMVLAGFVLATGVFSLAFGIAIFVLLGSVVFVVPPMYAQAIRLRSLASRRITESLYADLTDNVIGANDWIVSGRGKDFASKATGSAIQLRKMNAGIRTTQRVTDFLSLAILGGGAWLTVLWAGNQFGAAGTGQVSMVAAWAFSFFPLIEAFSPLNAATGAIDPQMEAVARLDATIDARVQAHAVPSPVETVDKTAPALVFNDVSFSYPNSADMVVHGLDLEISAGERVAVLGKSGCGKTTLARLACGGLSAVSGSVQVFGCEPTALGESITDMVAYIEQSPHVFNRTLRENLLITSPEATDDQLVRVLGKVGLSALLAGLPDGLDTIVDEAGMRFSGGERHRIALARVLLAGAPVVILDEPTVGLDPVTEAALYRTLFEALAGKTVVVITHHLAHVDEFDRVVFIADGAVALDGTAEQLSVESEHFRELLQMDRPAI